MRSLEEAQDAVVPAQAQPARPSKARRRWSARRMIVFVVGVSALLWAMIFLIVRASAALLR